MKYIIETWGCQMNEHDSEVLAGMLADLGYKRTDDEMDADVMLLNTCCVREKAESKVLGRLGLLKKLKQNNPDVILGVCGCMMQQPAMADRIKKRMPHMDLVFGTHNIHELPQMINEAKASRTTHIQVWPEQGEVKEGLPIKRTHGIKAFVNIMYGCNNFCTYCIVPYVRGRERSRLSKEILVEIKDLVNDGYREIMLLGQNVNSYGKDLQDEGDFADLLKAVNEIKGLDRIRFMTSHPRDFNLRLVNTLASCNKVCEHYHLPIQAGSSRILKKMNRGYTKEEYLELISQIKDRVPHASITTDIIVGFPGETEEDFDDTMEVISKVRFDGAYTFLYSSRPNTPAAKISEQVPQELKKKRFQKLLALQNSITEEINKQLIGQTLPVLFEGTSKNDDTVLMGRTRTNKIVHVSGHAELIGKIVDVNIQGAQMFSLSGKII